MTSSRRVTQVATLLCLALATAPAAAQRRSASDIETARELYNAGRSLKEQGDLRGALEKLKAAHALGRTPITGLELAQTYAALGQPVEARETCLGVARLPVTAEETSRSADARAQAAKLAEDVKPKIGTLRVKLEGLPPGTQPTLTIDGVAVPAEAIDQPRQANPGAHTIVARVRGGPEARATAELREGESRDVSLTVVVPAEPEPFERSGPTTQPRERRMSPLVVPGFVALGVGVGVGSVTGILALSTKSDLTARCPDGRCGPEDHATLDRGRAMGTVSTIAFVVGAAGGAIAVWGLTHPVTVTTRTSTVTPYVGPGSVGVHGTF
jgi:hypothetical protein